MSTQELAKPKLIPVKVPWGIASATPYMQCAIAEHKPAEVRFIASFLSDELQKLRQSTSSQELRQLFAKGLNFDAPEYIVEVAFDEFGWCRVAPAITDGIVIDEAAYDMSEVSSTTLELGESLVEWRTRFRLQWIETGICPNPGMYEVVGSSWYLALSLDGPRAAHKHYLLLGEEMSIEIIATGWQWRIVQQVNWF